MCCTFVFAQEEQKSITVLFNSNESIVSSESEIDLKNFFIDETVEVSKIEITGYCDDVGSNETNLILSTQRAQATANFIKSQFQLDSKSIIGKGELPLNETISVEESRKNNRKTIVEITFSRNKKPQTQIVENDIKINNSRYKSFSDNLVVGDKIIMKNLLFKGNLTAFENENEAFAELDKIVFYLNQNPNAVIEVQGHVCCISNAHNDAFDRASGKTNLSHMRAKKVYEYLIQKGISTKKMNFKGYGRKQPIPNRPEFENKRVEILITKI